MPRNDPQIEAAVERLSRKRRAIQPPLAQQEEPTGPYGPPLPYGGVQAPAFVGPRPSSIQPPDASADFLDRYMGRGANRPPMLPQDEMPAAPQPTQGEEAHPVRSAIGRALTGFARGFQATPASAAYNPWLGGLAGGLVGTGQGLEAERERQLKLGEPERKLRYAIRETEETEKVKEPYRVASSERTSERQRERIEQEGRQQVGLIRERAAEKGVPPAEADAMWETAKQKASGPSGFDPNNIRVQLRAQDIFNDMLNSRGKIGGPLPELKPKPKSGADDERARARARLKLK